MLSDKLDLLCDPGKGKSRPKAASINFFFRDYLTRFIFIDFIYVPAINLPI